MDREATWWWKLVHLEPALIRMMGTATAGMLAAFGILVSDARLSAILGFVMVLLMVIQWAVTRGAVTANARVVVAIPDPVNAPGKVVAGEATTTASSAAILKAAQEVPRGDLP